MTYRWNKTEHFSEEESSRRSSIPQDRQPCLVEIRGDEPGRIFCLVLPSYIIGRSPDCPIHIDTAGVSRQHCEVYQTPLGYDMSDLGSRNGTFVNGFRLERHTLAEGDRLLLGPHAILAYHVYFVDETSLFCQLHENMAKDTETGALTGFGLQEWLASRMALAKETHFDVGLFTLGLVFPEEVSLGDYPGECRELALQVTQCLAGLKKETSVLGRFSKLEFALAQPYVRESELQDTWQKLAEAFNDIGTLRFGLAVTREMATPTPEKLILRSLRNLRVATLSQSKDLAR